MSCNCVNCVLKLFRVCIVFVMYSSMSWIGIGAPSLLWALCVFFWLFQLLDGMVEELTLLTGIYIYIHTYT